MAMAMTTRVSVRIVCVCLPHARETKCELSYECTCERDTIPTIRHVPFAVLMIHFGLKRREVPPNLIVSPLFSIRSTTMYQYAKCAKALGARNARKTRIRVRVLKPSTCLESLILAQVDAVTFIGKRSGKCEKNTFR